MHSGPDGDASPATSGSGLGISFGLDKKGKQGRLSVFMVGGRVKKLDRVSTFVGAQKRTSS